MKKITCGIMMLLVSGVVMAQHNHRKLPSFGVHATLNDFPTVAEIRANGLSTVLRGNQYYNVKRMAPGLAVSYSDGLNNHLDFQTMLSGCFVNYSVPGSPNITTRETLLLEASAAANFKLLSDNYIINPYIGVGVGGYFHKSTFGAFLPIGAGLQFRLAQDVFIQLNSQYRMPVTEKAQYHLFHNIGFVAPLVDRKEAPVVPVIPVVSDRDKDGVPDTDDQCPDVPGVPVLKGCPDKDSDGIADAADKCPTVPGLAKYNGCPIPDTDGDGVNDETDKCPNDKGLARYEGCPIPDTDGDGVNDEDDKCIDKPGVPANYGCPEIPQEVIQKINKAADNIEFATGSDRLLASSNRGLNQVVQLMKADSTLFATVDGHTDTTGGRARNMQLSASRAKSVVNYLISKGISADRIQSNGYGPDRPIAPNNTAAGRTKNRRVEILIRNYRD
jgi:outer membrane protein OmpA-like peptidoglycan-associated protein